MTIYVDDSATGGDDDGTSAANAYLTIAQAISEPPDAGEKVLVAVGHTDIGSGGDWGGTRDNPVIIISADLSDDSYSPGASIISTGSLAWSGSHETWGMTIHTKDNATGDLTIVGSGDHAKFYDCKIGWGDDFFLGGQTGRIEFWDCEWNHLASTSEQASFLNAGSGAAFTFHRLVLTGVNGSLDFFTAWVDGISIYFYDSDLSSWGAKDFGALAQNCHIYLRDCKTSGVLTGGSFADNCSLLSERSGSGTNTPLGLTFYEDRFGTVETVPANTIFRTGGADDGEQSGPISWEMKSSSLCKIRIHALRSPPIGVYVAGGASKTFTVNLAHTNKGGGGVGSRFTDEELWIELSGPDDAAGAQGFDESTRPGHSPTIPYGDPQTAAVEAAEASASWNGSGVADTETRAIIYTPNYAGVVQIRVCLAKPSLVAVYIDPKIVVT